MNKAASKSHFAIPPLSSRASIECKSDRSFLRGECRSQLYVNISFVEEACFHLKMSPALGLSAASAASRKSMSISKRTGLCQTGTQLPCVVALLGGFEHLEPTFRATNVI
jgi:hypothetical protein